MTPAVEPDLEVHGEFWLPGADDKKVPGSLTFSSEGGGSLQLIGSFTEGHLLFEESRTKDYSRILAQDDKVGYTLDGCLRTRERQTLGGGARQSFFVGQVVKGVWFDKDEPIEAEVVDVEIDYLLAWTRISGISQELTFDEATGDMGASRHITGVRQEPQAVALPYGTLELRHKVTVQDQGIFGAHMTQDVSARFNLDARRPLSETIDYASDLQDLVSIATQRSAAFRGILLHQAAWNRETSNGRVVKRPARLYSEWRVKPDAKSTSRRRDDFLFTFEEFGGIEGLGRWMRVAETYRELLGRMMMTRYASESIVQDVVVSRVATLEGFDRQRLGGNVTLLARLERLADRAGAPFERLVGIGNVTAWCTKAKDYRHDIAHHLARYPGVEAAEMHYVGQAAY